MSEKSGWDKFSIFTNFFSGVVIAIVGIAFTVMFSLEQNNISKKQAELTGQQIQISQLQALETFIPYLREDNKPEMRKFAAERIAEIAGADYATQLASIYKSKEIDLVAEKARATGLGVGQKELPKTRIATVSATGATKTGWAYLGTYLQGKWKTRYFDFEIDRDPETIMNTNQVVRIKTGSLNVRAGMPDLVGNFPKVIDVLKVGSSVRIIQVKEWYTTGYKWARVEYSANN